MIDAATPAPTCTEAGQTLPAPATLPADDTRIVWKRDHGMVIVTGDEEPQSLEIPAWAVRTIFDVAGKDPEEEARKVSAFINAHTGLDVERLARALTFAFDNARAHCECGRSVLAANWPNHRLSRSRKRHRIVHSDLAAHIAAAYAEPNPLLTYTDPAGGPDWEPRRDEA